MNGRLQAAWFGATSLLCACALGLAGAPAAAAQDQPYVALGDGAAAGEGASDSSQSYVEQLFAEWGEPLGLDELINHAESDASIASVQGGGQLAQALADINAQTDTKAVTLGVGGAEAFSGNCPGNWTEQGVCRARGSLAAILTDLQAALQADPGEERFVVMLQFNPSVGTDMESSRDVALLGANGAVSCTDVGLDIGLNDLIFQEAGRRGIAIANPYPAFKNGAQSLMEDGIYPNDAGHEAIAAAFTAATVSPCEDPAAADADPPQTKITKAPPNKSSKSRARFKFKSNEAGSTFECKIDKKPFKRCTSPKRFRADDGKHRFLVRAIDPAGNPDPTPAKDRFKVVD